MTKNARYTLILFSICAVCALILAIANSIFSPIIATHQQEANNAAMKPLSSGYTIGEALAVEGNANVTMEYPLTEKGKVVGYILAITGKGYGGAFDLLASYKSNGALIAAQMMKDNETPGLGKKSEEDWYMKKFIGTGTKDKPVPTAKSQLSSADSDAISGASVTFGGVSKALAAGAAYVVAKGGSK